MNSSMPFLVHHHCEKFILDKGDSGDVMLVPSSQSLRHVILLERNRTKQKEEEKTRQAT